jgi:hypothetical protein
MKNNPSVTDVRRKTFLHGGFKESINCCKLFELLYTEENKFYVCTIYSKVFLMPCRAE